MFFKKIRAQAEDFYHIQQVENFFKWLQSQKTLDNELVFINLPKQKEFLKAKNQRPTQRSADTPVGFILCSTRDLQKSLVELTPGHITIDEWHLIGYASGIEIWENKHRYSEDSFPLRFGLSKEEKKSILNFSRSCMQDALADPKTNTQSKEESTITSRNSELVSLDIGVWVKGELRSSIIVTDKPLFSSLEEASKKAIWDTRMKPLELPELDNAQIEVSIFSDLKIPLRQEDINDSYIEGRMGYYVSFEGQNGWYIPTVFNCIKFLKVSEVIWSLIRQKARIHNPPENLVVHTFCVDSFIEDSKDTFLSLEGTMPEKRLIEEDFNTKLITSGDLAAEWLCQMQDIDGGMPLFADPVYQKFGRMDWIRLACTTHALVAYGTARGNGKFLDTGRKSFKYILRYVLKKEGLGIDLRIGTLIYCARTALILGAESDFKEIFEYIDTHWREMKYRPIEWATLATLFALEAIRGNKKYLEESIVIAEKIFSQFSIADVNVGLAQYPELGCTFRMLHKVTGDFEYLKKARIVERWLLDKQLRNGSFPTNSKTNFAYSRGTGKISETLAVNHKEYSIQLKGSFSWLMKMQYTEENFYFINPGFRRAVLGGLRHDYVNTEAWIDGAGHFLLGISRVLTSSNDSLI